MGMSVTPNFTPKSQQLILESKLWARLLNHPTVTSSHLLVVLLRHSGSFVSEFLEGFGLKTVDFIDFVIITDSLEERPGGDISGGSRYNSSFKSALSKAYEFSNTLGHAHVGVEHLFFALLNVPDGTASQFFYAHQLSPATLLETFILLLKNQESLFRSRRTAEEDILNYDSALPAASSLKALTSFSVNLTALARSGSLSTIIGKDSESSRIWEILGRKTKNNPLILGDPGIGKTAVVEGIAQRIAAGSAPAFLNGMEIYAVDLASMIAGTKYRGQFEARLKALIKECVEQKKVILFIDEIHTLVGAGSAEGTMDAANILKPALARGELKLIGATTFSEYKKSIEKDIALARRFEVLPLEEPSAADTLQILRGLKKDYERFHGVKYSLPLLRKIISLADIYLPSKNFPDKAIDILDEAGSSVKIKNLTPPPGIVEVEAKLYRLMESDNPSPEKEISLMRDYDKLMHEWSSDNIIKVTNDDLISIVSAKAKIPKENLIHEKDKKSLLLLRKLKRYVINQDDAVASIHKSILRAKIGLKSPEKPIGSFLFLGSTGVGKTWTAKQLALHYFGSTKNLLRFDMSEYSEKISSAKLIGAAPGYVGYEEGGILIESLKKSPHSVLLFDEIEKSHAEVQQLLLQILEEGELEDKSGQKAYFKDCIIILTGNIGSDLSSKGSLGFSQSSDSNSQKIKEKAKKTLSPELINRLDDIIVFNHLEKEDLISIFNYNIKELSKKLRRKKIYITISKESIELLCSEAASEKMGARPLKRLIQSEIEDQIVNYYFKKEQKGASNFDFFLKDGSVTFKVN